MLNFRLILQHFYNIHNIYNIIYILLAKDREFTGKPLQLGRTYHRRTLTKTKTTRKATGNHPGKYVIHETEYADAPPCGGDMPSRPLTWSITLRQDMLKNVINLLVTAEDY